jgi:hypothetical protein
MPSELEQPESPRFMQPIEIKLDVVDAAGRPSVYAWRPEFPAAGEIFLTTLTLSDVDGGPILRVPFHLHSDSRMLHTVCSRIGPGVETVEW